MQPDEKKWLQRKCTVLADWSVELATKPLVDLRLSRLSTIMGEKTRALNVRLQDKVYGDVTKRKKILPPKTSAIDGSSGLTRFGEKRLAEEDSDSDRDQLAPSGFFSGISIDVDEPELPPLIDKRKLQDARLRSQLGVDLRAYERCVKAGDYRLATVMLASIMEAALLDHVIPRRAELGLSGTPDTWPPHELLLRALGDAAEARDPSLAFHLFASRNLLRPALQMVTPAVVTDASMDRMREFVERCLHKLGYRNPNATLPPGSINVSDLPQASRDE